MRLPKRIVSIWTVASLLAHSLLLMAASPPPAYALTVNEAQSASGRIGAGTSHSLALTGDGTVIAWGDDSEGQNVLAGSVAVTRVAAGADHSLALKSDGTVVASGLDSYGQCQVPPGLTGVIAIAAGEEHSLALRSDGTVFAWGANTFGQSSVPAGLTGVIAIAAGGFHSLALKSNGTVVAWGANGRGQSTVPSTLTGVVGIAAGGFHSLALRSNGTVAGWGSNDEAQRTPPSALGSVVALAAGWRHSLALKSDGTVVAWGGGGVESSIAVPSGLNDVIAISAGWRHSLALRSDGTPVGWGLNASGQCLGPVSIDPAPNSKGVPTDIAFRITYSAPVKAGAAYSQIGLEDSQGRQIEFSRTTDGALLVATPSVALLTDERYILRVPVGALLDDYGNSIGGGTYYYDTLDTVSPSIVSVQPVDGATGVSVNGLVGVEFSENIAWGPGLGAVSLSSGAGHAVECMYSTLHHRLVITPLTPLKAETSYTLTVPADAVTDLAGNPLAAQFTSGFTTGRAHTINAVAGTGGSISPSGAVLIDHGANRTFAITPGIGYVIDTVQVDGESVTLTDGTYTFDNVTFDRVIEASFALKTHTLSYTAGQGGSIVGATPQSVSYSESGTQVTAFAHEGYEFVEWSDGVKTASRTDTSVTGDIAVEARFIAAGDPPPSVIPIAGSGRYDTAIETAREAFPNGADTVVIATGENWPDALGGTALAGAVEGPVLLVQKNAVPSQVMSYIEKELKAKKVIILGGHGAVSKDVESALKAKLGKNNVDRIAGSNRYDTANRIATRVKQEMGSEFSGYAFVATGGNFPDALAAAPLAAAQGWPLYLADPKTGLSEATKAAMGGVTDVVILGGTGAVGSSTESYLIGRYGKSKVTRLQGANRYETAVKVATYAVEQHGHTWNRVGITTGANFPDALAGGVLQGNVGSVMVLTEPTSLNGYTKKALTSNKTAISTVTYFGGTGAISGAVRTQVADALK